MKPLFLFLTTLFLISIGSAQDLIYKIPEEANVVVSAKGNKFQEFVTLDEFNRTKIGEKILNELFKDQKDDRKFQNLGIDFSANLYYYNQRTDSTFYNCYWLPLSDPNKFDLLIKQKNLSEIKYNGNTRKLSKNQTLLLWDNDKLLIILGEIKQNYFNDSIKAAQYGIKDIFTHEYEYPEDSIVIRKMSPPLISAVADSTAYEISPIDAITPFEIVDKIYDAATPAATEYAVETTPVPSYDEDPTTEYIEFSDREYYDTQAYNKAYEEQNKIKEELLQKWIEEYAVNNFNRKANSPSILDNPAYQKSQDKNAAVTFFINISQFLYTDLYDYPYYSSLAFLNQSYFSFGGKNISGKLFINKENIRWVNQLEVDAKELELYKGLYNHKLNKKFLNYIDTDKIIGFISNSFNTKKYLELYPKWMAHIYAGIDSKHSDEANLFAELFSLLLDEKAVAKVIKGDALFLFNGLSTKEYTYTSYDYDDDYKATEVEKTKKETLPEFLFMSSSDDPYIIEAFLKYGVKKEKIKFQDGIYSIENSDIKPFSCHVLIKDGIIFLGTSYEDIYKIKNNSYSAKMSKNQKNLLLKNNMTAFFNSKNLVNQIPKEEFEDIKRYMNVRNLLNSMGSIYAKSTGIKGNYLTGEMVMETEKEDENALKYFLRIAEMLSDL